MNPWFKNFINFQFIELATNTYKIFVSKLIFEIYPHLALFPYYGQYWELLKEKILNDDFSIFFSLNLSLILADEYFFEKFFERRNELQRMKSWEKMETLVFRQIYLNERENLLEFIIKTLYLTSIKILSPS